MGPTNHRRLKVLEGRKETQTDAPQIKSIEIMHNLEIMHVKDLLPDYRQNYVKVL